MKIEKEISRKEFVKLAGLFSLFPVFDSQLNKTFGFNLIDPDKGIILHKDEGEHYLLRKGSTVTIKVSKEKDGIDSMSFCWEDIIAGDEVPVHKHLKEDELIYIESGEGDFTLDENMVRVKAGSMAFVPKNTWHGLKNTGSGVLKMLFSYHPSGFEGFFREVGHLKGNEPKKIAQEEFVAICKKYNMVFKDLSARLKKQ